MILAITLVNSAGAAIKYGVVDGLSTTGDFDIPGSSVLKIRLSSAGADWMYMRNGSDSSFGRAWTYTHPARMDLPGGGYVQDITSVTDVTAFMPVAADFSGNTITVFDKDAFPIGNPSRLDNGMFVVLRHWPTTPDLWGVMRIDDIASDGSTVSFSYWHGTSHETNFSRCIDPRLIGGLQSNPIMPDSVTGNTKNFDEAPNGLWIDPAIAETYDFATTDGSLITSIEELPDGFESTMQVWVGDSMLAENLGAGDSFAFPGSGVDSFTITGISATTAETFALRLGYDSDSAALTMTAAPEPASISLLVIGGIAVLRRRRRA